MTFNPNFHHRKSIRLPEYDYSRNGHYFITVCACQKLPLFGDVVDGNMVLNEAGQIVFETWSWLSNQYEYVQLDEFVVMPNHFHGILIIDDLCRGGSRTALINNAETNLGDSRIAPTKRKSIGRLIGAFKTVSTKNINKLRSNVGTPVWQRNYYERIIRNESELASVREYIQNNPAQWAVDDLYI